MTRRSCLEFFRYGGKYFLCLVIGCYCESPSSLLQTICPAAVPQSNELVLILLLRGVGYGIGLCMRIPFRSDPHNTTIYIVQYLFIVLSVSRLGVRRYAKALAEVDRVP